MVTDEEKESMKRLLNIMEGNPVDPIKESQTQSLTDSYAELNGPGVVSRKDVDAMANILSKLQKTTQSNIITEGTNNKELVEALETEKVSDGVKVGKYQIMIKEDQTRLAGKQYYSIYHGVSKDVIADDISLYETALAVVRLLNKGKFVNSVDVQKLFEHDMTYTSHRVDALLYKRRMNKGIDSFKRDIYESRFQASLDKAMAAKKQIKVLSNAR